MKHIKTYWKAYTYKMWGNENEGYEVNQLFNLKNYTDDETYIDYPSGYKAVFSHVFELRLKLQPYQTFDNGNAITGWSASPSAKQIRQLLLCPRIQVQVYGDDTHLYVERLRDGWPLGELCCVSHKSLRPVFQKLST